MHLGVDAGNSKTAALLCGGDGRVLGCGRSGPGDIYGAASPEHAVDAVLRCVEQALAAAGAPRAGVTTAAFRLAGVDWPEDLAFWEEVLARSLPELRRVSVRNDGFAAIRCAEPSGVGIAVAAGTGPAVAGRGRDGEEWCVAWWAQEALGAAGLGDDALRAVYRQALGLGPRTVLTGALLAVFGDPDVEELLHSFTRRGQRRSWQDRARAARAVLEAAAGGDQVAVGIVTAQGRRLAEYARVAAVSVGFSPARDAVPVVLAGSVLTADGSPVTAALLRALAGELPRCRPVLATLPPVAGAALDAVAEAGLGVTAATLATMARGLPAAEFLLT